MAVLMEHLETIFFREHTFVRQWFQKLLPSIELDIRQIVDILRRFLVKFRLGEPKLVLDEPVWIRSRLSGGRSLISAEERATWAVRGSESDPISHKMIEVGRRSRRKV